MKAELIDDFKIMGVGTLPKGTKLEIKEKNNRFVYCDFRGLTLKCSVKEVKIIK